MILLFFLTVVFLNKSESSGKEKGKWIVQAFVIAPILVDFKRNKGNFFQFHAKKYFISESENKTWCYIVVNSRVLLLFSIVIKYFIFFVCIFEYTIRKRNERINVNSGKKRRKIDFFL